MSLVGMPGSGKSRLGSALADALGLGFVDVDFLTVARIGKGIGELFETEKGESLFRRVEKLTALDAAASPEAMVISLGGGGFMDEETRKFLLDRTFCCWLDCSTSLLWQRLRKDERRPLLKAENQAEKRWKLEALVAEREPFYRLAHYRLRLNKSIGSAASVAEIRRQLQNNFVE